MPTFRIGGNLNTKTDGTPTARLEQKSAVDSLTRYLLPAFEQLGAKIALYLETYEVSMANRTLDEELQKDLKAWFVRPEGRAAEGGGGGGYEFRSFVWKEDMGSGLTCHMCRGRNSLGQGTSGEGSWWRGVGGGGGG